MVGHHLNLIQASKYHDHCHIVAITLSIMIPLPYTQF